MRRLHPLVALALLGAAFANGPVHAACNPTAASVPYPTIGDTSCHPGKGVTTGTYNSAPGTGTLTWGTSGGLPTFTVDGRNTTAGIQDNEFDYSVARTHYGNKGDRQGYGSRNIAMVNADRTAGTIDPVMTYNGAFSRAPVGGDKSNFHMQTIIWLNKNPMTRASTNGGIKTAIDVTITDLLTGKKGELVGEYNGSNGKVNLTPAGTTKPYYNGSTYTVLRRRGDLGERANYLIVRDAGPQNSGKGTIDPMYFLNWLISYERTSGSYTENGVSKPLIDSSWYIAMMGWEITGKSAGQSATAVNFDGGFRYGCYSIPTLVPGAAGKIWAQNGTEQAMALDKCPTGGTTGTTPPTATGNPVGSISNAGPVVAGRVTNVPVGWTVLLTAATGTSRPNRSTTTSNASGDFSLNLAQYPEFVDGITVNYYSAVSGKPAATGSFIYKAQPSTQPQITISKAGPIVQGRAAHVPQGWTVLLTASTGTSRPNRSTVTTNTLGDFSLDLRQYPEMINGMVVNYYTQVSSGKTSSGTFTYVR